MCADDFYDASRDAQAEAFDDGPAYDDMPDDDPTPLQAWDADVVALANHYRSHDPWDEGDAA